VIGIGAGPHTDGQVLVFHDLVGLYDEHVPKYVKRYAEAKAMLVDAVRRYGDDVRQRRFPSTEHEYRMEESELVKLRARLQKSE
jgi:3-methyl-2-oxobutanoate hydroxymethyltransferase